LWTARRRGCFQEAFASAVLIETLFERFGGEKGNMLHCLRRQDVHATIVPVSTQRNSRDENDDVNAGNTPVARIRQKDMDAPGQKHGESFHATRTTRMRMPSTS
jgi:hypothetical protein